MEEFKKLIELSHIKNAIVSRLNGIMREWDSETEMRKIEYRCINKNCLAPVEKPGRCKECTRIWNYTCQTTQSYWTDERRKRGY